MVCPHGNRNKVGERSVLVGPLGHFKGPKAIWHQSRISSQNALARRLFPVAEITKECRGKRATTAPTADPFEVVFVERPFYSAECHGCWGRSRITINAINQNGAQRLLDAHYRYFR